MHRFACALALALTGCTSLLGVEDVELVAPDAGIEPDASINNAVCDVDPRISLVTSNPATTVLSRNNSGGASMALFLNTDTKFDSFGLSLYDNMGNHGALNAPGTYALTAADTDIATCGICVTVFANYDSATKMPSQIYFAEAAGSLTLIDADATRFHGRLQNLQLRHVNKVGSNYVSANDSCRIALPDVEFDMTYPAP